MMRKYIKILSFALATILTFSCVAYAEGEDTKGNIYSEAVKEELDYIDDIYRFDLNADEEEVYVEPIDDERAVFTVLCLGIMNRMEDGSFSQDLPVSFEEFSKIVHYLSTGAPAGSADYSQYRGRNTTMKEAAEYLVKALGYGELAENGSVGGYIAMAKKLGLISGNVTESKFITRGELASMVYTALYTDVAEVTSFKSGGDYTIAKGGKLINDRLNIFEIKGVLSGVPGVNIYSTKVPDIERIEIDRVSYDCGDNDFSDLLGKYVFGYVRNSIEDEIPFVLGLTDDSRGRSITIKMSDVVDVGNDYIKYNDNDSVKKLSTDNIENVLYNGDVAENFTFTEELFENDGEIVFTSTKGNNYNLLLIWAKSSYRIRNISKTDAKLFFADSLKFKEKEYIEFDDEDEENFLKIVKNGKVIAFDDIIKGDVISIIQSDSGRYTHITVCQKIVMGKIDGKIDDNVTINGVEYRISKVYKDASEMQNSKTQKLITGTEGRFYLTSDGTIAGFEGDDGIQYGLLGEIANSGGLKNDLIVRFLTEKGEWKDMYAASKLELDGQKKIPAGDAYDILSATPDAFYQPIRYKVNGNDEITFLDTIIENSEERTDQDSIKVSGTWVGTTSYSLGYVAYSDKVSYYLADAVVFCVPDDKDNEKEYSAIRSTSLPSKTSVALTMYSADNIGRVPVVIYEGHINSGGGSFSGNKTFALESVKHVLNDDGEYNLSLSGYEQIHVSPGVGSWNKVTFKVNETWLEENPTMTFKPGDVFFYQLDSKGMLVNRSMLVRDNQLASGSSHVMNDSVTWCFGEVTGLDFSTSYKLVKISFTNPEGEIVERTFVPRGVQIYDSQSQTFESAMLEELEIGDTILATGNYSHVSVTVFR